MRIRITWFIKNIIAVIILIYSFGLEIYSSEVFSIPENLKDNVIFWKKVYTELSLQEGVLHDSDYPLIIYKTIQIGDRTGRSRTLFIRHYKNIIISRLKSMVRKHRSKWTSDEERIAELYEQYASLKELNSSWKRIRFQQGQKERYKEGLERSGAYMAFIRLIFKIYRIPGRIGYLPHVESSFNINAYSRVGAAGMWQFMHRTARLYKLKIDYRIDERRDPIKSTIAAAKLLMKNYSELGSWPLALTAYNHGLASIKRAVRTTKSTDLGIIIEKYKNRRFKFASKNFYGCFLAASEIAANPEKYFDDINYKIPLQYHEVELENFMQPNTIAENLEIPIDQLKEFNPALRPSVFSRKLPIPKGYKLRIPTSLSLEVAQEKLSSIPNSSKKNSPEIQTYYTVKRGDTLSSISRKFRVSLNLLLMYNDISSQHRIYIGQVLRVPGNHLTSTTSIPSPQPQSIKPESVQIQPEQKSTTEPLDSSIQNDPALEKPQTLTKNPDFDANLYNLDVKTHQENQVAFVTVSVEESLGHYAEWLNTSLSNLRHLNGGKHNVQFNQKIKIPLQNGLTTLKQFNARRLEYHMAEEEDFYNQYRIVDFKEHRVKYGETLWSICNRDEEIPLWILLKFNPKIDLGNLKANTRLTIPVLAPKN